MTTADAEYGQDAPPTPFELEILEGALMVATGARGLLQHHSRSISPLLEHDTVSLIGHMRSESHCGSDATCVCVSSCTISCRVQSSSQH